jgi:hypothetical protein
MKGRSRLITARGRVRPRDRIARDLEKEFPDVFKRVRPTRHPLQRFESRTAVLCLRPHLTHTPTVIHIAPVDVTICYSQ